MATTVELQRLELDALREVANIASGHAATALGQLTDRRVMITVPEFSCVAAEEIPGLLGYHDQPVVVVAMQVLGDLAGSLVFLMPEPKARELSEALLRRPAAPGGGVLDALARSSLSETANILGGAYTSALGTLMGRIVMLSVPVLGIEPPDGILRERRAGNPGQVALCIETALGFDGCEFGGHILLLPDGPTLRLILESLRVG